MAVVGPDTSKASESTSDPGARKNDRRSMLDASDAAFGSRRRRQEARPPGAGPKPGDVRRGGRQRAHHDPLLQGPGFLERPGQRVHRPGRAVPVVHRAVRQLRRGRGRGPGQGAGRHAAQDPQRDGGPPPPRRRDHRGGARAPRSASATRWWSAPGELIPCDGEIVEGIATVDESAITGESAPVIRESGGDRSAVTGGTRVLSDEIVVRITARPGETFVDRMIALVEGSERQKTPNEIALNILLAGLTIIFLLATVTLQPFAIYSGAEQEVVVLVALLVCLIPTTIGGLLSAIGIAGMDRLVQRNVLAMSGRAVEAAGDVRHAAARQDRHHHLRQPPGRRVPPRPRRDRPRAGRGGAGVEPGRRDARGSLDRDAGRGALRPRHGPQPPGAELVPFTAQTRMSGSTSTHRRDSGRVDPQGRRRLGSSLGARTPGVPSPPSCDTLVHGVSGQGGTPLVVAGDAAMRRDRSSASSTSRTSSSRAWPSASPSCGPWASAR